MHSKQIFYQYFQEICNYSYFGDIPSSVAERTDRKTASVLHVPLLEKLLNDPSAPFLVQLQTLGTVSDISSLCVPKK